MIYQAKASHIGSCLSMGDLLAVLYGQVLRIDPTQPDWALRDRFILSKGHGAAILYAVLAERGFFPVEWLDGYNQNGSLLTGHANAEVPGVELSTGALGHGLPVGCGMALAGREAASPFRVFVLMSDGECDEGSTWEAALFAAHHHLDNLTVILDYNKIQSFGRVDEVLKLEPLASKWTAFGWAVREIDGHDLEQIALNLNTLPYQTGKPNLLIAHTIKGKGISFMEDQLAWHYKSPNPEQLAQGLAELEASR
jgi:transketolase